MTAARSMTRTNDPAPGAGPRPQTTEPALRSVDDDPGAGAGRARRGDLGEVPVGALVVRAGRIISQAYQSAGDAPGPDRPRRAAGPRPGPAGARLVAAGRLRPVRHPRAVRHVRRGDRPEPDRPGWSTAPPTPRPVPARACTDWSSDPRLNHRPEITAGVLAAECGEILTEFFQERRRFRKLVRCDRYRRRTRGRRPMRAIAGRPAIGRGA